MSSFKLFFKCFYSPSLYVTYRDERYTGKYNPDPWEKIGDLSLSTASLFWKITLYASPFLATMFYRRGYMNADGVVMFTRISLWLSLIIGASFCLRSYGRATNSHYKNFLSRLSNVDSPGGVKEIKKYDFDFDAWPVEFHLPSRTFKESGNSSRNGFSTFLQSPCSILGYIVLHTFGIKMIYPGSMSLINFLFKPTLIEGRTALVVDKNGIRHKLKTPEGNIIDTMFIDGRQNTTRSNSTYGRILVICSEGNAGFYENGIMGTAIDAGFSVLGWNHPGFGCSTGMPYIDQEDSAMNTVMEFAIQKLGFPAEQIILYGWSIGGYTTSWAATAYPSIKAVVVDATFDDILPLAINHMPSVLESIVRITVRSYADLNVGRKLSEYPGNIKLIRRADDEVIAIVPGDIRTNRGNFLLKKLLKQRYPQVISNEILNQWLATTGARQGKIAEDNNVNKDVCKRIIDSYVYDHGPSFPFSELGKGMDQDIKDQITIYLADKYMKDYASTHCVPLPSTVFLSLIIDDIL